MEEKWYTKETKEELERLYLSLIRWLDDYRLPLVECGRSQHGKTKLMAVKELLYILDDELT